LIGVRAGVSSARLSFEARVPRIEFACESSAGRMAFETIFRPRKWRLAVTGSSDFVPD
jgi:hypothetical protein